MDTIDLDEAFRRITTHWDPHVAAELNDARAYYMGAGYASSTLGLVQSWLSDVQELVERGHKDAARVIINRCKFLLDIERDEMARAAR